MICNFCGEEVHSGTLSGVTMSVADVEGAWHAECVAVDARYEQLVRLRAAHLREFQRQAVEILARSKPGALLPHVPACGRLLIGQGDDDTHDPVCGLADGHHGPCVPAR